MAEYITFQPSDYFSTLLWEGTGASNAITGVGFQPDIVWIKDRDSTAQGQIADSPSGATKYWVPSENYSQSTNGESIKSFDSDGYTLGTQGNVNASGNSIVGWNWKGGTTSGIDATGADITPTSYSFNQTGGISVIRYTGNGTTGAKIAHGLGSVPQFIFVQNTQTFENRLVYHVSLGNTKYIILNTTAGDATAARWNDATPTSVYFEVDDNDAANKSGETIMAYCFAEKKGFSKFSSYVGNGNANGPFIYTGFRPNLIIRKTTGTDYWSMVDTKRLGYNPQNDYLFPSSDAAEGSQQRIDILSNGFKVRTTDTAGNTNGTEYIYAAFAEFPIVSSNDIPTVAR